MNCENCQACNHGTGCSGCQQNTALNPLESALLDEAWDFINSDNQLKDGNYAYILHKYAPSLDYFKRPDEAQACRHMAKEIYSGA